MNTKVNEYVTEVCIDSDDECLHKYFDELNGLGYSVTAVNSPVVKHNNTSYTISSYKYEICHQSIVQQFMVGETLDPDSFQKTNYTQVAVDEVLYGIFYDIKEALRNNNKKELLFYNTTMRIVYDHTKSCLKLGVLYRVQYV